MCRLVAFALVLGRLLGGLLGQQPGAPLSVTVEAGDARVPAAAIASVGAYARDSVTKLAPAFPGTPTRTIRAVVHSDADSLVPSLRENLHDGTAGFALLGRDEMHILLDESLREPPNDLRTVVVHELVHVLLDQCAGAAGPFVPRWVHEGLAQTLSGGPYLGVQEEHLLSAVLRRRASRFSELEADFPARDDLRRLAYAQSFSFVAYLVDEFGVDTVVAAARECSAERSFDLALLDLTDRSRARLQDDWENYVLFRSGAAARYLLRNCFSFLVVLAVPLLVIAGVKRSRLNRQRKEQLAAADSMVAPAVVAVEPDEEEKP